MEGGRGKFSGILVGDFTEAVKPPQTAGGGESSGRVIDGYAAGSLPTHSYEKPKPPKPWMPGNEVICLCSQNNTHVSIPNPWVNEPYKTPWGETLTRITATLRP